MTKDGATEEGMARIREISDKAEPLPGAQRIVEIYEVRKPFAPLDQVFPHLAEDLEPKRARHSRRVRGFQVEPTGVSRGVAVLHRICRREDLHTMTAINHPLRSSRGARASRLMIPERQAPFEPLSRSHSECAGGRLAFMVWDPLGA